MFDLFEKPKRKRTLTQTDKKSIAHKQDWKCKKCGKSLPVGYHVDHIKEFSAGGSDNPSNLQALCPNCHAEKTENDRRRKRARQRERTEFDDFFKMPERGSKKKDDFDFW